MSVSRSIRRVAVALAFVSSAASAMAASERAPAEVQKSYDQFMVGFRAAVKANDPAAVASMTAFPFLWNDLRDEASFQKDVYPKVFTRKVRDCIGRGRGFYGRDGYGNHSYTIFCGEQLFVFGAKPGGFRFTDIGIDD